jgi:hypothetical protein
MEGVAKKVRTQGDTKSKQRVDRSGVASAAQVTAAMERSWPTSSTVRRR